MNIWNRPARLVAAALAAVALSCAPGLDRGVPRSYLAPVTGIRPGAMNWRDDAGEWLVLATQLESGPMQGDDPARRVARLGKALERLASRGVEAVLIDRAVEAIPELQARAAQLEVILVPVETFTGTGWSLTLVRAVTGSSEPLPQARDLPGVLREIADRGDLALLRQPCAMVAGAGAAVGSLAPPLLPGALEISGPPLVRPDRARELWQRWLREGGRVVGLGGGWRYGDVVLDGVLNLVRTRQRTVTGIVRALAAGRVQVVRGDHRPRLHLGVDVDGDGRLNEARQGDRLAVEGDDVKVEVRVVGGAGADLLLYTELASGPCEKVSITATDEVAAFRYPLPERGDGFVRAELYRGGDLEVISNPLYLTRGPALQPQGEER